MTKLHLVHSVASIPIIYFAFRICIVLPATALEHPIEFGVAWRSTKTLSGAIFGLSLIIAAISFAINLVMINAFFDPQTLSNPTVEMRFGLKDIWTIFFGWVQMIVGVSILTTLYGVAIEKRELV